MYLLKKYWFIIVNIKWIITQHERGRKREREREREKERD